jgi:hypothetical protein
MRRGGVKRVLSRMSKSLQAFPAMRIVRSPWAAAAGDCLQLADARALSPLAAIEKHGPVEAWIADGEPDKRMIQ